MVKIRFSKNAKYNSKPIIIDGFSGSGKILISELLKAVNNTEISKWELSLDYLPILYSFGAIEKEAAISTLRTIFDEITYTMSIGREINLRRKDLQFALRHPKKFIYLKSIFSNAYKDEFITEKVAPKMNIPFMVHMSTFNNNLIEETFKKDTKLIYTLRDPLYIIETYSSYIDRISKDPREFTPKILHKNLELPWYARGWEEEYCEINNTEKSIKIIEICFKLIRNKLEKGFDKKIYKLIFFENITINPDKYFLELTDFLNLNYDKRYYQKVKLRNKLPRSNNDVVEGFWKRYTTDNISRDGDKEQIVLERTKNLVQIEYFNKLLKLRDQYFAFKGKYQNI